jgi:hypothetical protein
MSNIPYIRHEVADSIWIQIDPGTQTASLHFQAQRSDFLMVTIPLSELKNLGSDIARELLSTPPQPVRGKAQS